MELLYSARVAVTLLFSVCGVTGSWAVCACAPRRSGRPCSRSAGRSWAVRPQAMARPARRGTTSLWPSPLAGATSRTGGRPPFFLLATFSKSGLIPKCSCAPNAAPNSHINVCVFVSQSGLVVSESQQNPGESGGHPAARWTSHHGETQHHPPLPPEGKPAHQVGCA